jgi:predicted acetyltransferase
MGFGYGTKMNEYRVRPSDLPAHGSKDHLVDLGPDDSDLLLDYYNRNQVRTHGMLRRSTFEIARKLSNPQNHLIGYRQDGRLHGYLQYRFRSANEGNFLLNDMEVFECLYDTPEVLKAFLKYVQTQADQIRRVVFWTQEEDFHYLFLDPRNGSDYLIPSVYHASNLQGVGLMYRVLDTELLLRMLDSAGHSFADQTCRLHLELTDSLLPANSGTLMVELENGQLRSIERVEPTPQLQPETIAIHLDVADFSSLVLGAVRFKTLYAYGLARLSDPAALDQVDWLFHTEARPRCVTAF